MIYLYLLLLRIVAYLEGPPKIILFIVVIFMISFSILKRVTIRLPLKSSKLNTVAFALILVIIVHSFVLNEVRIADIAILLTYWFWLVFMMAYFKGKNLNQCLRYILISFFIFNLANYLFFLIYFSDQKIGVNSILGIFGIYGYRIYFPLSSGANIFTSQLALNALISLYFIKLMNGYKRLGYLVIYIFYIYMLILADSRLILLFALIFSIVPQHVHSSVPSAGV